MLKRVLQSAIAIAVLASVALLQASPAAAATQGPYGILGFQSERCIAIGNASTANDVPAIIWNCHSPSTAEQRWYFTDTDSGFYLIQNQNSGRCLTVLNNATTDNASIIQHGCNTSDNEEWTPYYRFTDVVTTYDYYWLWNRHSNKCLSTKNDSSANGTALVQITCGTGGNQYWTWGRFAQ